MLLQQGLVPRSHQERGKETDADGTEAEDRGGGDPRPNGMQMWPGAYGKLSPGSQASSGAPAQQATGGVQG